MSIECYYCYHRRCGRRIFSVPDEISDRSETSLSPDLLDTLHEFERMLV